MNVQSPNIETDRLLLRPPMLADFEHYAALHADHEACRYIGGGLVRAAAWRKFLQMPGAWSVQGFGMFSVIERGSGQWIGQVGPWRPEGWPGNEIGWSFLRSSWGRGYAREAAIAAIDWAVAHLGWQDFIHCIHPDNSASAALASRLGSRRLRRDRVPPPFDGEEVDVWGQTADAWRAARRVQAEDA